MLSDTVKAPEMIACHLLFFRIGQNSIQYNTGSHFPVFHLDRLKIYRIKFYRIR